MNTWCRVRHRRVHHSDARREPYVSVFNCLRPGLEPASASRLPCDLPRRPGRSRAASPAAAHTAPRLKALVACAGVLRAGRMEAMSVEDFDLVFNVNMRGSWLAAERTRCLR